LAKLLWTKEFKERFCDRIFVVPELNSVYYLNGSNTYASMRIRRLDMLSGEELASFLTRAFVYNLAFCTDYSEVVANTEKRLFLLSATSLSEILRCESRVPSNTTSMLHLGRTVAMKGEFSGHDLSMYDLNTMKIKKIKLRAGGPLYRDIESGSFLACCSKNGSVWRIDAKTYAHSNLLSRQIFFDWSTIDHKTKTLWLSEESMKLYKLTNIVHKLSLCEPFEIQSFTLDYPFKRISVSEGGEFLWVAKENFHDTCGAYHRSHVCVLSVHETLKEVQQFEFPDNEDLGHMDARAGLIFTEKRYSGEDRFTLSCWKM